MVHLLLQSVIEGNLFLVFVVSGNLGSLLENKRKKNHETNKSLIPMYNMVLNTQSVLLGLEVHKALNTKPVTTKVPAGSRQGIKWVFLSPGLQNT